MPSPPLRLGFVVGLTAEARIAARTGHQVQAGGGTSAGAAHAAQSLITHGVQALVSFGLAGGLDPALRPGTLLIPTIILADGQAYAADRTIAALFGGPTGHMLTDAHQIAASRSAKRELRRITGADAVDLETGTVARVAAAHNIPFAVVRAVCDPAARSLPPAALVALDENGRIAMTRVAASLLTRPWQIPSLIALAHDAALSRRALVGAVRRYRAAVD